MIDNPQYPRVLRPPDGSFFLFGLRGAGKSTWARTHFPGALRLDLLDERLYQAYLVEPELFGNELRRQPRGAWVVVDEVQRLRFPTGPPRRAAPKWTSCCGSSENSSASKSGPSRDWPRAILRD